ncbi:hypothetical protein B7486_12975 [cyanobacterium TDX16]|nr:hypothetical protein B7486_12975 [cyanobacterium TDX16]
MMPAEILTEAEYRRELEHPTRDADDLAEALLCTAEAGEFWAMREVLDNALGPAPTVVDIGGKLVVVSATPDDSSDS